MADIAKDSGHWYRGDGSPCYTMLGKNGQERAVTLRDARAMQLVPSVTSILSIQAKPALTNWLIDQALQAALTLPRLPEENLTDFMARAKKDAQEQSEKARDRGTALHGAIEKYLLGQSYDLSWEPHVNAVKDAMRAEGMDLHDGLPEKSFASALGYGGKVDWHNDKYLVDYKSKPTVADAKNLIYDEHHLQSNAYNQGLGNTGRSQFIVFVGVEDKAVRICEVDPDPRYYEWFLALLRVWKLSRNYLV